MNMRWLWTFLAIVLVWFFTTKFLGIAGTVPAILMTVAILLLVDFFFHMKTITRFIPITRKFSLVLAIGLILGGAFFGYWTLPFISGTIIPSASVSPEPISAPGVGVCANIPDELIGRSATVDVNAWDMESNTPYASAVDVNPTYIFVNGVYKTTLTDTSASSFTAAVGDVVDVYPGGSSYYGEAIHGFCIDSERPTLEISAHAIAAESNLAVTVYDDTGSTELSSGTSNCEDYTMTMGADESKVIYVKLKVNAANKAYQVGAVAVAPINDIEDVKPSGASAGLFEKIATPKHLKSVGIIVNQSGTSATITKDYTVYKLKSPVLLHEWDSVTYQFTVEAGSTDPSGTACTVSGWDGFAVLFKDATYYRGDDGNVYFDIYTHDSSEADVGLDETENSPYGKQTGALIRVA